MMSSVFSRWCMVVVVTVVFGIPVPASAVWFQVNIYGTNTYKSTAAISVSGVSDGYSGRCIFGTKDAAGVVVEEGGTNFTSGWTIYASNIYSWSATLNPTAGAWTVSPPAPGMPVGMAWTPDHYFAVNRYGTQYAVVGPHIVIP